MQTCVRGSACACTMVNFGTSTIVNVIVGLVGMCVRVERVGLHSVGPRASEDGGEAGNV